MLLLLRSAASGLPAGNAGITLGTVGIAGPVGAASITFGVPAPTNLEINVFAAASLSVTAAGIPVGFVSGTATGDLHLSLIGFGGFGFVARGDITLGVAGTVGSTLQGIGNASTTLGGTGAPLATTTAGVSLFLNLSGAATISGGTLTPSATTAIQLSINGSAVLGTLASGDIDINVAGTGYPQIVGLATQMRLSFSCDEIRTFFRKG